MSQKLRWRTALTYVAAIGLGLALGPALGWLGGWLRPPAVQAAPPPVAALAPDSPEAIVTFNCTPTYVGEFSNRVHVQCSPADGAIQWFATPTSDSKRAARVLSVMLTARSLGKVLRIYYDTAANGSAYGCALSDCRPITYIEMAP